MIIMLSYNQQKILIDLKSRGEINSFSGQKIYKSVRFYKNMAILTRAKLVTSKRINKYNSNQYKLTLDGHMLCNYIKIINGARNNG